MAGKNVKSNTGTKKVQSSKTKSAPAPAAGSVQVLKRLDIREKAWTYLFPVLLFLVITAQSRFFAVVTAALLLVFILGKKPIGRLGENITLLTAAVMLYVFMNFIAGLYSNFGEYAVVESAKAVSASAMFLLVLAMMQKKDVSFILKTHACVCAVISLLCIDASSLSLLTKAYSALMGLLRYNAQTGFMGYETGVRITGIFWNPNVSAGILAFGVLISCYLVLKAKTEKQRGAYSLVLGVNSMGFLLSFSMGAMAAFGVSCLIFLICEDKAQRLHLFLLMLACVFSSVVLSFAAYPFLGKVSVFPLLVSILNGGLIYALERFAVIRLSERFKGKTKYALITAAVLALLVIIYAVLALSISGSAELSAGETLRRAAYLDPGEYSLNLDAAGEASVLVYSQNQAELMMHTNTEIYNGNPSGAVFTVPENSRVTWFVFTSGEGAELLNAGLSGGTGLKLGYPLLPDFAANRLQGLFANQNLVQRTVFFEDGIKVFKQSPMFGSGLGAVEGLLTSVQDFYYESVYIHNHFIQILDEMGIVGLILFVFMLVMAVLTLVKGKTSRTKPLFALLMSCVAMMIFHSVTEVVWSTGMYQTVCYLIFSVIILEYGESLKLMKKKAAGGISAAAMCLLVVIFGALIGGNLLAAKLISGYEPTERTELLKTMKKLDKLDCYEDKFYKSTYIMNAVNSEKFEESNQAAAYAKQLLKTGEYRACTDVAMYYYLPKQLLEPMFEASRTAIAQEASNPDSWNLQMDFYQQSVQYISAGNIKDFIAGVMKTLEYHETFNAGRMEEIVFTENNQKFADSVRLLSETEVTDDNAYMALVLISAQNMEQ